jgi:uncharacterized protein YutE (UPF0331/DUF86 family)
VSPARIDPAVAATKAEVVRTMLRSIESLPLSSREAFVDHPHAPAAGESYLRRSLEALLDLGRHLLAKGFGVAVVEYKEIPRRLREHGVIDREQETVFISMAGYRNRLVHSYDEVGPEVLFTILTDHQGDIVSITDTLTAWVRERRGVEVR